MGISLGRAFIRFSLDFKEFLLPSLSCIQVYGQENSQILTKALKHLISVFSFLPKQIYPLSLQKLWDGHQCLVIALSAWLKKALQGWLYFLPRNVWGKPFLGHRRETGLCTYISWIIYASLYMLFMHILSRTFYRQSIFNFCTTSEHWVKKSRLTSSQTVFHLSYGEKEWERYLLLYTW